MTVTTKSYTVRSRYLVKGKGWEVQDKELSDISYEDAGREASVTAQGLDRLYGSDHFWTVDLLTPEGGSYYQFFHGRTS